MNIKQTITHNLLNIPGWRTKRHIVVIESDDWGSIRMPSKEVYKECTLAKRPILTIETNDIKEKILSEFLEGNYANQDAPIDISRYDIHNVAQQFLSLCR